MALCMLLQTKSMVDNTSVKSSSGQPNVSRLTKNVNPTKSNPTGGSIGRLLMNYEQMLRDSDGRILPEKSYISV